LTYSFGLHSLDEGLGGKGATVILKPGAIAEDADGRVCEKVSVDVHTGVETGFRVLETSPRRMDWGIMSCDWPCLPNTAPMSCEMISLVLSAEFLIKLVIAAEALPVTSAASLNWMLVEDRRLSVV
jgi:hypothetical protein